MTSKYIGRSQAVVANQAYSKDEVYTKTESDANYLPATNESLFIGTSFGQTAAGYGDDLVISKTVGNNVGITLLSNSSNVGSVFFGDEGDADVGGIRYYHDNDHMRFITGGTEAARVNNSGLSFNSGSNYLDSYEEGTITLWELTKSDNTFIGSRINHTVHYVKVGRLVHIQGYIRTNSVSGTGNLVVAGILPFPPAQDVAVPVTKTRTVSEFGSINLHFDAGSTSNMWVHINNETGNYTGQSNNVDCNTQTNLAMQFSGTYYTNS